MGLPHAVEAQTILAVDKTQKKGRRTFQSSLKRYLQRISPFSFLSKLTDCYVDSMNVAASHMNDSSLVHGPYIGSLQHSASRGLHREEDDLCHVARTLSKRDAPSFPRSASYAGATSMQLQVEHGMNWGRSRSQANVCVHPSPNTLNKRSHASVYAHPSPNTLSNSTSRRAANSYTQRTTLSVTYEESDGATN